MEQAFNIENYQFVKNNNILVYIVRNKVAIPITIPKELFELWLLTAQRLITILVLHSEGDKPQEQDAIMSYEEYWQLPDEEIHADLYSYIISHPIVFRGQVYNNPLVSIEWGFNRQRATLN